MFKPSSQYCIFLTYSIKMAAQTRGNYIARHRHIFPVDALL